MERTTPSRRARRLGVPVARSKVEALTAALSLALAAAAIGGCSDDNTAGNNNNVAVEGDCTDGLDDDLDGATDCDDADCDADPACVPEQTVVALTVVETDSLVNLASGVGSHLDYTPLDPADQDAVSGGFSRVAAVIKAIRTDKDASNIPLLLVDAGDWYGGSVYDLALWDPLPLAFFQMLAYDAVNVGNQELYYTADGLAQILGNALPAFTVPVLASNMIFSDTDARDDALEDLAAAGVLVPDLLLTLENGLTVGLAGNLGPGPSDPLERVSQPLAFDHDFNRWQDRVDSLRVAGAELVLLVSQGKIDDVRGDDLDLALNVSGIDIIASGNCEATNTPFVIDNDGGSTIVSCPGMRGGSLSQLDVVFDRAVGAVTAFEFRVHAVDDSVVGDPEVQALVDDYGAEIDALLLGSPLAVGTASPVAETSIDLTLMTPLESNLTNLCADALRTQASVAVSATADPTPLAVAVFMQDLVTTPTLHRQSGTGVVTFADAYATMAEGASPTLSDPIQGWPLVTFYLTPRELTRIANAMVFVYDQGFLVTVIGLSGMRFSYDPGGPVLNKVTQLWLCEDALPASLGGAGDYYSAQCGTELFLSDNATLLRVVTDLLTLRYFDFFAEVNLPLIPKRADGSQIDIYDDTQLIATRIDADPSTPAVEELKPWAALYWFLIENLSDAGGIAGVNEIPEAIYGPLGSAMGRVQAQ